MSSSSSSSSIRSIILALCLAGCICLASAARAADPLVERYQAAVTASRAGDAVGYAAAMREALEIKPGHPILMRHLAQALAMGGDAEAAIETLEQIGAVGASFDYAGYAEFESLLETEAWRDFVLRNQAQREPSGTMELAFEIAEDDLVPEGISYDSVDDVFYVSSIAKRKIVRVDREGNCSDFIATNAHGYYEGLGLEVDAPNRLLWAVSAASSQNGLFDESVTGHSALHVFSLKDGSLYRHFDLGPSDDVKQQGFNDLALHRDGSVYISNASSGAVHRWAPGMDELEEFLPPGSVGGANGICVGGDYLYVSKYVFGIVRVDLKTRELRFAGNSEDFTSAGVDGLYYHDGKLVAVQNFMGLDRVSVFQLDADGMIESVDVRVARHPVFEDPTTGSIIDGKLFFIANSRVEPFFRRPERKTLTGFGRAEIFAVDLD